MEKKLVDVLNNGGIAVIPTDTIYGISARALDEKAVRKVHEIKERNNQKPFIILVSSIKELKLFGIEPDDFILGILNKYWSASSADKPGKVTVILDCPSEKFHYLHLGTKTLAFRIPDKKDLLDVIKKTGPLISTSANPEDQKPASTIEEARNYFGSKVDFYLDEGKFESLPSTLIKVENGKIVVLRKGAVEIN
jgi:L-threonylcarbamoyladenylate synthase